MRRIIALAAVLVLVTTACKIETNFGATIQADGSGTVIIEIGFDEEAAQFFLEGDDPFEDSEFADDPNARVREEQRGDLTVYILEADVDDVSDIREGLVGADGGVLNDLTIVVGDELVTVSGTASAEDTVSDAGDFDLDIPIDEIFSSTVFFTMPGQILEHNADRRDGNTLYWNVPLTGGALDVQASSDPTGTPASGSSDGGFPVWGYAVLAALLLGAAWFFLKGRSNGSTATPAEEDSTIPPPPPAE